MKHQVMFVYGQQYYDELDSEWETAVEAAIRLKELFYAGFSGSYIKSVPGKVTNKQIVKLHARPIVTIVINGTPLETHTKFKTSKEAEEYLRNNFMMFRGVTYEIHVTNRYDVSTNGVLPIHLKHADKEKFFNKVDDTTGNENYCGGY